MDRKAFFASLRRRESGIFGMSLSQNQVAGVEAKIDIWEKFYAGRFPDEYFAACMGQAYRETGGRMVPVLETYAKTREQAAARLQNAFNKGQLTWVETPYWGKDSSGQIAIGGGDIQLTHRANYVKANDRLKQVFGIDYGLDSDYDKILDPFVSAQVLFLGMIEGWFRPPRNLEDYNRAGSFDYYNARDIVNADKRYKSKEIAGTIGDEIVRNCKAFETAVKAGGGFKSKPAPKPTPKPAEPPADSETTPPAPPSPQPEPKSALVTILEAVAAFIKAIFGRK